MNEPTGSIVFYVIPRTSSPPAAAKNVVYLRTDHWNDYSYITMFDVTFYDNRGERHEIGNVKIGFKSQDESTPTYKTLAETFTALPPEYFSVGLDVDYYIQLRDKLDESERTVFLRSIRDVDYDEQALTIAKDQLVFQVSHLRSLSINTIQDQFRRVVTGGVPLTDFNFRFPIYDRPH